MHELEPVRKVIEELAKSGKRRAKLELGRLVADPGVFADMFREMTKGTGLEGFRLDVEPVPVEVLCRKCKFSGKVKVTEHLHFARCPKCGKMADILSGDGIRIIY
jgi:Zn finger protein HypA/HybF involved in hydrogenase expression